jgi:hypothetical protein
LQFYPRGYIFDKTKSPALSFRYNSTADGKLANISSIAIENVPTVKAIKVMYSPQTTSNYDGDGDKIYTSPVVLLGAAALTEELPAVATAQTDAPLGIIKLSPVQVSGSDNRLYSYAGYLVVEKEIVEYDAIKYTYEPSPAISGQPVVEKWITSDSEIQASQALSKPNTFKATGQYRIKKRNAFDIVKDNADLIHKVDTESLKNEWSGRKWNSLAGPLLDLLDTPDQTVFTLQETPIKGVDGKDIANPNNLFYAIPRSMMTIFAPVVKSQTSVTDPTLTEYVNNTKYSMATINAKYSQANGNVIDNFIIGLKDLGLWYNGITHFTFNAVTVILHFVLLNNFEKTGVMGNPESFLNNFFVAIPASLIFGFTFYQLTKKENE